MVELDHGQFWMLDTGEVVQVTGIGDVVLTVLDPLTRDRWHVNRVAFEERIATGRATEVEPNWEPAGPTVAEA